MESGTYGIRETGPRFIVVRARVANSAPMLHIADKTLTVSEAIRAFPQCDTKEFRDWCRGYDTTNGSIWRVSDGVALVAVELFEHPDPE